MGRDRVLDPLTGDYVSDGQGGYETTTTIQPALVHQLKGQRSRWWGDENAGSDVWRLQTMPLNEATVVAARNFIRTAVQVFIDRGQAREPRVDVTRSPEGRLTIEASIVDVTHGELDISNLTRFDS